MTLHASLRFAAAALLLSGLFAVWSAPSSAQTIGQGSFSGRSNHVTTGGVSVRKTGNGYQIVFASNFNFDGAPDPRIGFGNNGRYDRSTTFAALQRNTGSQTYTVPASINAESYSEVWLWCERFAVPLGVARVR